MLERLRTYSRFVKIEHSVFALPMVLAGALLATLAGYLPGVLRYMWRDIGWILLGAFAARVAGFALNRIIDRHIDRLNPRTDQRELPAQAMTLTEAYGILAGAIVVYALTAWLISPICLIFSPIPLLVFLGYPFLKRFTPLAHFGVGLSLAFGPLGAGIAILSVIFMNRLDQMGRAVYWFRVSRYFFMVFDFWPLALLSLFTFFWVSGFDIIYSTMDEQFDREQGLHSLPARLGRKRALNVSAILHALAFVALLALYVSYLRTPVAGVVLSATGALLFLEQYTSENVDLAFFKINGIISFLVLGLVYLGVTHR